MKTTKTNYAIQNDIKIAKTTRNLFGLLLVTAITLTSCKKPDKDQEDTNPDGTALTERFENNRSDAIQSFTLNIDGGAFVTGSEGTKIIFPTNSLGLNGTPVTGNVEIELIEIYNKAAMLLQNMPTTGIKPNGDHEVLKSGGEFFLNATQNGNQLEVLLPIQIQDRGTNSADWQPMQIFRAGDDVNAIDLWEEADENDDGIADEAEGRDGAGGLITNVFGIEGLGWTNLDRWYNYSGALTDIFIDTPDAFTDDTCEVYISYDGEPTALARMDVYNSSTGMFTEHYGRIPVGQEIHVILIAEINGTLHSTIQGTTVINGHIEVMSNPQPTTQADLETAINALP